MTRVLYIDDETALLTLTQIYLKEEAGLEIEIATSAMDGLDLLKQTGYDAIISDYDMPDVDGIEFLKMIREFDRTIPFIIFTGKGREEVAIEALNNGADFYIQKGGDPHLIFTELANAIRHLVRRSHAERNAVRSEEQLRSYLNALPDIAFMKGPDFRHLLVNNAYLTFLGLSSVDDVIGKTDDEILSAELAQTCRRSDELVLNQNLPISDREVMGSRVFQVMKFPLPFPGGHNGIGGIIREMTDILQARTALHESEERFRSLAESQNDVVMRFDRNHRHLYVNSVIEEQIGIPAAAFIGKTHEELGFPPDLVEIWEKAIDEVFTTGIRKKFEFRLPSGLWVECIVTPERAESGEIKYVIFTGRDVTARKAGEAALQEANHKIQLLAGITRHDIMNKINIISLAIDALQEISGDNEEMKQYLEMISRASVVVKNRIDFSRDYQELGLHEPAWQDLAEVISEAAAEAIHDSVGLTVDANNMSLFADPLLKRALYNIFENSVRHGERVKQIHIAAGVRPDGSAGITISDDGVGVPAEIKEQIFEEGIGSNTGYGLYLVKEILAITGISIRETGQLGSGATFEISIPPGRWKKPERIHT